MATALREVTSENRAGAKRAFVVMGMHRSGTSAMTRTLSLLGARLPSGLMPAVNENNETGFWEPQSVADLNDEILQALDSEWDDVFSFRPHQYLSNFDGVYLGRAVELLEEEFEGSETIVLKDPRISVLGSFWDRALRRAGYATHYVVMVRNPLEVAESLRARDGFPREKSLLLWTSYMVAADRDTRNHPRIFVSYDQLISNWRAVRQRIENHCRIPLPRDTAMASLEIDRYLELRLRHHKASPEDLFASADVPEQTKRLYGIFLAACDGVEVDEAAVDQILAELTKVEALVGPLLADLKARGRTLEKELGGARQEAEAAKARVAALGSELAAERERLDRDLEEKRREAADLATRLVAEKAEREHFAAQSEDERNRIILQSRQEEDRAAARIDELQREISDLAGRLAAAEHDRDQLRTKTERQGREAVTEVQSLRALLDNANEDLSAAKAALEGDRALMAQERDLFVRREAELTAELHQASDQKSKLEFRIDERFREIAALTAEVRRMHLQVAETSEALASKESELGSVLTSSRAEQQVMEGRLEERFKEIATLGRLLAEQETRALRSTEDAEWLRQASSVLLVESTTWKGRLRRFLPAAWHYRRQRNLLKQKGLFDGEAYLALNSDVAADGIDPLRHYLRHGILERRPRG